MNEEQQPKPTPLEVAREKRRLAQSRAAAKPANDPKDAA
jgi:hypothetical protein